MQKQFEENQLLSQAVDIQSPLLKLLDKIRNSKDNKKVSSTDSSGKPSFEGSKIDQIALSINAQPN